MRPRATGEITQPLEGETTAPELDDLSRRIAQLAARGLTVIAMARQLKISTRSVDRHLARLRERFGVGSTRELAVELARRGY